MVMKIENHLLTDCEHQDSPNRGGKFAAGGPDSIIIHYTAGSSAESSIRTLCNPDIQASAHLVVGRDGAVTQLIPFDTIAWHAGRSSYQGRVGFNKYSIGIEIDNAGRLSKSGSKFVSWFGRKYEADDVVEAKHRNESKSDYWHAYSEEQISAVSEICEALIRNYPIDTILGHEEIAPKRKSDPGPAFPLDKLREHMFMADRSQEEEEEPDIEFRETGLVTASKLNIRESSDRGARTVAPPLAKGALVKILDEKNGWYQVEAKTTGWVKKDYVKT
jgi:N-acetylmuramoyl-L-alanine amidase